MVKSQLPSNLGESTKGASDALGAVTPFFNKFVQVSSPFSAFTFFFSSICVGTVACMLD